MEKRNEPKPRKKAVIRFQLCLPDKNGEALAKNVNFSGIGKVVARTDEYVDVEVDAKDIDLTEKLEVEAKDFTFREELTDEENQGACSSDG